MSRSVKAEYLAAGFVDPTAPQPEHRERKVCLDLFYTECGVFQFGGLWVTAIRESDGKYQPLPLRGISSDLEMCCENAKLLASIIGCPYIEERKTVPTPTRAEGAV